MERRHFSNLLGFLLVSGVVNPAAPACCVSMAGRFIEDVEKKIGM